MLIWVAVQIALFVTWAITIYAAPASEWGAWRWLGAPLLVISALLLTPALIAHGRKLTPFPEPNRELGLLQHGVYAFVRHPIYLGLILMAFGWAILFQKGWGLVVSALLTLFFHLKAGEEEHRLLKCYPDYADYMQHTGRLLPRWQKIDRHRV